MGKMGGSLCCVAKHGQHAVWERQGWMGAVRRKPLSGLEGGEEKVQLRGEANA